MSRGAETVGPAGWNVVEAHNVSKVFKRNAFEVTALDDVSLDIELEVVKQ